MGLVSTCCHVLEDDEDSVAVKLNHLIEVEVLEGAVVHNLHDHHGLMPVNHSAHHRRDPRVPGSDVADISTGHRVASANAWHDDSQQQPPDMLMDMPHHQSQIGSLSTCHLSRASSFIS